MSRRFNKVLIFIITVILLVFGIIVVTSLLRIGTKTTDDASYLFRFLEQQSSQKVLGVNSRSAQEKANSQRSCPDTKPIIGWIQFDGKKTITQDLPVSQSPSACFTSVEEANMNEFFYTGGK